MSPVDLPDATRTREQQFAFLRAAHDGPLTWHRLCLSLARQAPGLPAVYPSALAAAHATPEDDRVYDISDLRRGMVAYFDDPNDDNPAAHVVTVSGWDGKPRDDLAGVLNWTNDAARTGGVDLVRASFFPEKWGDSFLFGATSLNGYDLPGYGRGGDQAAPKHEGTLGDTFDHAIADLRKTIRFHREKGHDRLVAALVTDLAELKQTRAKFRRR